MLSGYLGATEAGSSPIPAAAAARLVSLPLAAVAPLLPTSGNGASSEHPNETGDAPCNASGSRKSSLLMGDGAAAWLQGGGSAQYASTGSRMPGGGDGGDGGSVRFFRTGDLGRVDAGSGLLVLGGRCDLQIKIRGVRREPEQRVKAVIYLVIYPICCAIFMCLSSVILPRARGRRVSDVRHNMAAYVRQLVYHVPGARMDLAEVEAAASSHPAVAAAAARAWPTATGEPLITESDVFIAWCILLSDQD